MDLLLGLGIGTMIPDWPLVLEDTSVKLSRVSEDCTRIPEYRKHGNPKGYGAVKQEPYSRDGLFPAFVHLTTSRVGMSEDNFLGK